MDRYRKWNIVLDGEVAGSVANGQTSEVAVECGIHTVRVGHRWWSSPTKAFSVGHLETVEFVCRPRPHPAVWFPYGVASLYRHDLFIVLGVMPREANSFAFPSSSDGDGATASNLWVVG